MKVPKHIVIVGGGTAGWMAANLFAHQLAKWSVKISLIESSDIPTVGVGEGSTPYLKEFFDTLGISESQWMPACNATFKCGIRFPDWSTVEHQQSYFHPFYCDLDGPFAQPFFQACNDKRNQQAGATNPDEYFFTSRLTERQKAPKRQNQTDTLNYGYHFDAALLARFLKQRAIKSGVNYIDDTVESVHLDKQGNIAILATRELGPLRGDFFVDCSGFKGLLIQQTLGEKLNDYSSYLYCDRAVALPSERDSGKITPETLSRAMKNGWMWKIPLANRYGNGYVYSSRHMSEQDAEQELRETLGLEECEQKALHLKWMPGRINQHWKQNCVAIGLSQGFLEPLEAPMLFIVQRTIEGFLEHYVNGSFSDHNRDKFNQELNTIIDGTRDYLQAHYKLNSRDDTAFWRDSRENTNMSPPLADIVSAWGNTGNFDQALAKHEGELAYLKTSWYCLLAGLGFFPQTNATAHCSVEQKLTQELEKMSEPYFDHKQYLDSLYN